MHDLQEKQAYDLLKTGCITMACVLAIFWFLPSFNSFENALTAGKTFAILGIKKVVFKSIDKGCQVRNCKTLPSEKWTNEVNEINA